MSQVIASDTRVTHLSRSLIDVILASHSTQFFKAGVIDCLISDHDIIVFADMRLKAPQPKVTYIKTRSFINDNPY